MRVCLLSLCSTTLSASHAHEHTEMACWEHLVVSEEENAMQKAYAHATLVSIILKREKHSSQSLSVS